MFCAIGSKTLNWKTLSQVTSEWSMDGICARERNHFSSCFTFKLMQSYMSLLSINAVHSLTDGIQTRSSVLIAFCF